MHLDRKNREQNKGMAESLPHHDRNGLGAVPAQI